VSFCEEVANEGKVVIVAALDGTFEKKVRHACVTFTMDFCSRN
jgi:hypothetical protein